ncbi:MAG: sigma-54-dependent Fis family transcriptional regulator [Peptostreptococcaceae bacterium]|nr:sigma-54-dependent Fis family transcriptional regulator [Peptostreptococcaceae bacterium]
MMGSFSSQPVKRARILIVDDEEQMCISLKTLLENEGFVVDIAFSVRQAFSLIANRSYQLIISDIRMPEMGGLSFLARMGSKIPMIMITAHASLITARRAFKLGASDYLAKPFKFDELLVVVNQFIKQDPVKSGNPEFLYYINSKNQEYLRVLELAQKFSTTDLPILITGESGTGKEVITDYIYQFNKDVVKPEAFVKINCAAIPIDLLESELFGYEKGAFSGATSSRSGKIEEAHNGILLLDEIGDMPLVLQAKILRVVQDLKVYHVGSNKAIAVNARIIAASNQDLNELVQEGKFRLDLYYRLKGVHLHLPALRDRREDIPCLTNYFLEKYAKKYQKPIMGVSPGVEKLFMSYNWPGNIRELKYCIERSVVVCDETKLLVSDLPDNITIDESRTSFANETFSEFQPNALDAYRNEYMRKIILQMLEKTNGNKQEAAKLLNISRQTLYNRMKELDIQNEYR